MTVVDDEQGVSYRVDNYPFETGMIEVSYRIDSLDDFEPIPEDYIGLAFVYAGQYDMCIDFYNLSWFIYNYLNVDSTEIETTGQI